MKKILLGLALCTLLLGAPALSMAGDSGIYVAPKVFFSYGMITDPKISGGGSVSVTGTDKEKEGWGGALAVGYDFFQQQGLPFRAEVEYAMRSQVDGGWRGFGQSFNQKYEVQTLFFNAYYDIPLESGFTPYLTGGVGMASIDATSKLNGSSASSDKSNFAYNLGLGCGYDLSELMTIDLGYRYASFGEVDSGHWNGLKNEADLSAHEVGVGLRFKF